MNKQQLITHTKEASALINQYITDKKTPVLVFLNDSANSVDDRWEVFCSMPDSWLTKDSCSLFDPEVLNNKCFYDMGIDRYRTVDVREYLSGFVVGADKFSYHEGYDPDKIHNEHSGKTAAQWLIEYKEEAMSGLIGSFIHNW